LYKDRLAAAPEDADLYAQAVALMARQHCDSEFFIATAEHYYGLKHLSETAMMLAEVYQKKGNFSGASKYLSEALDAESDASQRQKLLVRIAFLESVSNKMAAAAAAARQARELDPEDGVPYFILAQCYASSAAVCDGFSGQAVYWVAYDTMAQAIELLQNNEEDAKTYLTTAKQLLSSYRSHFPTNEELFFNEVKEGTRYTVGCGLASGISTVARAR
ncbi:MAG: enzyme of heme biosynthesis, partial [Alistipes sp.]|nr:enzyme of heme biosynthesis [Alistipes sp.]